jgi:hypothetical protein
MKWRWSYLIPVGPSPSATWSAVRGAVWGSLVAIVIVLSAGCKSQPLKAGEHFFGQGSKFRATIGGIESECFVYKRHVSCQPAGPERP